MERLLLLITLTILALHVPTVMSGWRPSTRPRLKDFSPPVTRENFETAYALVHETVASKAPTRENIQQVIQFLESRPIATEVAELRDTRPQTTYYMLGFYYRFHYFIKHLPTCRDVPLNQPLLKEFEPLFTWNEHDHHFTVRLEITKSAHISLDYDLYRGPLSDLCGVLDVLRAVLSDFFLQFSGGAARRQLEEYLVQFVDITYKLETVSDPFNVEWSKLLRMQLDARSMKEHTSSTRAHNLEYAIDEVVDWIRAEEGTVHKVSDLWPKRADEEGK